MNAHSSSSHRLQPLWNLAAAPMLAKALQQALQYRLFDQLGQPASATDVAQLLTLNPATTAIWLDVLWSMGLLHRHAGMDKTTPEYVNTELAAQFFCHSSPQGCSASWQVRAEFLAEFAQQWGPLLREGIQTPDALQNSALQQRWAQAAREHLGQEQRVISAQAVLSLLDRLPSLPPQGRFADVGGGPGHVAVALAQRLPGWQGVVVEQEHTATVAQETIHAAGLEQQLSAHTCDLNQNEAIGNGYDLIWCSSVLHFLHEPQAAVQAMYAALNPGGQLLLAHAELSDDPVQAAQIVPFYAGVMLRGGYLPRSSDIPHWMHHAGFTNIRALGQIPWALSPLSVYVGSRL